MSEDDLKDLNEGLRPIAASDDGCTLMREAAMLARKKELEETREHKRRILEEHREHGEMVHAIKDLSRGAKDIRCAG